MFSCHEFSGFSVITKTRKTNKDKNKNLNNNSNAMNSNMIPPRQRCRKKVVDALWDTVWKVEGSHTRASHAPRQGSNDDDKPTRVSRHARHNVRGCTQSGRRRGTLTSRLDLAHHAWASARDPTRMRAGKHHREVAPSAPTVHPSWTPEASRSGARRPCRLDGLERPREAAMRGWGETNGVEDLLARDGSQEAGTRASFIWVINCDLYVLMKWFVLLNF